MTTDATPIRQELAWLLYGWSLPNGQELPDGLPTEEYALWEVKARGILSLIGDKLTAAGHADAAGLLTGQAGGRDDRD